MTYEDRVGSMLLDLPIYELHVELSEQTDADIKDLIERIKNEKYSKAKKLLQDDLNQKNEIKKELIATSPIYEIAKKVKVENRDKFIAAVKSYIDRNLGNDNGWEVIFSNDYTKIKKQTI